MNNLNTQVRVIVSGCLGVCEIGQQAFGYFPNKSESIELYTTMGEDQALAKNEILNFIKTKTS